MDTVTPNPQDDRSLEEIKENFLSSWKKLYGIDHTDEEKEKLRSLSRQKWDEAMSRGVELPPEKYNCEPCRDGKRIRITNDRKDRYFGKSFPCPLCVSIEERVKATGVPSSYVEWNLDQLDMSKDFLALISEQINAGESVVIFGQVGRGKTHTAVGLLRNWLLEFSQTGKKYRPAKFIYYPHFLDEMRKRMDSNNRDDGKQYEDELAGFDLLVVDDLGAERTTEWTKERTTLLIDRRLREGKQTIITTNVMSLGELADRYGERTASRLGAYRWKECEGVDHRIQGGAR